MRPVRTASDIGQAIREHRKALQWDQATLAREAGVSRQWVVEVEKGKGGAELELVLRALRVLGAALTVARPATGSSGSPSSISRLIEGADALQPTGRTGPRRSDPASPDEPDDFLRIFARAKAEYDARREEDSGASDASGREAPSGPDEEA